MHNLTNFLPDWASPPGGTISELLAERGLSVVDFANSMGSSTEYALKLLEGSSPITEQTAVQLSAVLGGPAAFWLSRESQFRDSLARIAEHKQWLKKLPVADMIKFGWLTNVGDVTEKIAACLSYFGVATVADWHERYEGSARLAAFRTSGAFESEEGAVLAWLRKGEIDSETIECGNWNREQFHAALPGIRELTRQKDPATFLPLLKTKCAEHGVAVVFARAPSGCRASGATRFLTPSKALLMLSGRHRTDDHFWFTFFHEAGHLVLHDTRRVFLEGETLCSGNEEQEANDFASNTLIPVEHRDAMRSLPREAREVMRFARKIGVSPGIVVGQLQHLRIFPHNALHNLKVRYDWGND